MPRKAELTLEFQNYIERPPVEAKTLYSHACSSDQVTVDSWRQIWIDQVKANHKKFGSFKSHGIGQLFGKHRNSPAFIIGSGPSLKYNGHLLKNRGGIPALSCLHNFHFFEDRDIEIEYYVTLDAGDVVVEEVYEGGQHEPEWYWERTKGKKLLAFIGTSPKLLEKWQGEVFFYNCPVPDDAYKKAVEDLEPFHTYVSNGGNVLGACLYIAKGIFGCNPIIFLGADFSFSYDKKFHGWDSKYDSKLGHCVRTVDIYGNKVLTWQSYFNFKAWFDWVAMQVPGIYINCTEGGTFGAYPEGNIMQVKQMELQDCLDMYSMSEHIRPQSEKPEELLNKILF